MKKIGLIINPIAGMGGAVGLKGTDGREILNLAISLGAIAKSEMKSEQALITFIDLHRGEMPHFYCYCPSMGLNLCEELGLTCSAFTREDLSTDGQDTRRAAKWMEDQGVGLIVFSGGDGTARDILLSGIKVPVIGIPTGVKIHSSVFALTPKNAGRIMANFLEKPRIEVESREVMDLDEELYRQGHVRSSLFGYLDVPIDPMNFQGKKSSGYVKDNQALEQIAARIVDEMEEDTYYFVGPGSSTQPILELLDLEGSLLGVDIILNKRLIKADATEKDLLQALLENPAKVLVSVIGGQGYLFGRGNHQFSSEVLEQVGKQNIIVIATANKLASLRGQPLRIDLDNPRVQKELLGFYRIPIDYSTDYLYKCSD